MLLLFGFYNVRDDVSPSVYADAERSIAGRYRAGAHGWTLTPIVPGAEAIVPVP